MRQDIIQLLMLSQAHSQALFAAANSIKLQCVNNTIYLRGLIEYSNICRKNCYYCGLRQANSSITRYTLTEDEVLKAAVHAWQNGFGSIVIQSGEVQTRHFTKSITRLLNKINEHTNYELGITLSLGEQSQQTLAEWRNAGAIRYLLRVETSNPTLYTKLHPTNTKHSYTSRIQALETLKKLDYQVGTGVMIGLPEQTIADLADDILFMQKMDIDMIGMGPYVGHSATPMFNASEQFSIADKVLLTLKMTAILRVIMRDINIAATTAMQTLDPHGRAKAIYAGANVIMPNITPQVYRNNYLLYENKPTTDDIIGENVDSINRWANSIGAELGLNKHGNSLHYQNNNWNCNA